MTVTLQIKKNTCKTYQAFMKYRVFLEVGALAVLTNMGKVISDFQPHERFCIFYLPIVTTDCY